MSARLPVLTLVSPPDLLRAAERILSRPTCARASLNEVVTFALATTALAEIAALAARQLLGTATPADLARLREHLLTLGVLAPGPSLPPKDLSDEG